MQPRLGIIDAAFYLIACLTEHGRSAMLLRRVQQSADADHTRQTIADALPERVAATLGSADFDRIGAQLKQSPVPEEGPRLSGKDWRGGLGVFLIVFLSTLPVIAPFPAKKPLLPQRPGNECAHARRLD
jgi:hypothetical protein